jgi:hypothetical protein
MKKTLQDQYLSIKEGKGHKGVFLTEAKRQFPNIVRNAATFDEAVASLKTKNIISENVLMVMPAIMDRPKKESYETAFEDFLAEARKAKENEDEKVKAEEKKVSKPVEKDLEKNFDYSDEKNPDNMIFDQIMMGYYAEMKDPKNADKTMQELKDIVFKNLSKDPIHYTKDGQFGIKDLGYVTEHPGLGEPKEAKGKYKSSGYGDLNESQINEMSEKDIAMMDELDLKSKLTSMGVTPIVVNSILSTKGIEGLRDSLRNKLKDRAIGFKESKEIEVFKEKVKKAFTEKSGKKFSSEEIEAKLNKLYPGRAERKKDTPEESKLREVIREMVDAELEEAYQLVNIRPRTSDKEREERDPQDQYPAISSKLEDFLRSRKYLRFSGDKIVILSRLIEPINFLKAVRNDVDLTPTDKEFVKFLSTSDNIGTTFQLPSEGIMQDYTLLYNVKLNRNGKLSFFKPAPKKAMEEEMMESLRESVEKDLADINKEAEHEVLQAKLDKIDALIDHRRSKLSKLDEDEDMKALTDKKKVKELEKDIKKLEQAKSKVEKMMSKFKGKKKEVIDETEEDLDVASEYLEDAESRLDAGQDVDSIVDTYDNMGTDQKNDLDDYLNNIAPDDQKSDYVY